MLSDSGSQKSGSWLKTPPESKWPSPGSGVNPFVHYRELLWSWHRAMAAGWSDEDFVWVVEDIDRAIARTCGTGFHVTPFQENISSGDDGLPGPVSAKVETGNVAGSHKARHLMGLILHMLVDEVPDDTRLAISSCGNAAFAAATVAGALGRPIDVFIPTWADSNVVEGLNALGATIHVCERREGEVGDPCMTRFQAAVACGSFPFSVQAIENRWVLDGGRTIGWELADQIADKPIRIEDLMIQVGGGALLASCAMGLIEAHQLGRLAYLPRVWAVQAAGCAPFDRAWKGLHHDNVPQAVLCDAQDRADELMYPWENPHSLATGILDDVTYDWQGVVRAMLETGGGSIVARESEIRQAHQLTDGQPVAVEPTGSAGLAGVLAAQRLGQLTNSGRPAVLLTGRSRHH